MINTDKYEGHTPAPWDGILSGYFTIEQLKTIDKTLMQDAPLLLEEVKQLREALVGDSKDWTTDELVEKIFTLYDKAHAWDKMLEYYSENKGTENDSQEDWEMREEMNRILREVKE